MVMNAHQAGNLKVIAVNDNYLLAPWADILYACDVKWWQWHIHRQELIDFQGEKVTQDVEAAEKYGIKYIKSEPKCTLSTDPAIIYQGSNSGYQAINLAYHTGVKRVLLLGYDQKFSNDGKAHWFGDHPDKVRSGYDGWRVFYESLATHAADIGFEIINCTTETALTCFKKIPLDEVLQNI